MSPDTVVFRVQQHRDRWSWRGGEAGIVSLSEKPSVADLRKIDIFQSYDDALLETLSADISIASWASGAVLFEEGGYIDLAFYILEGEVGVYLSSKRDTEPVASAPIFERHPTAQTLVLKPGTVPADSLPSIYNRKGDLGSGSGDRPLLSVMDFDLPSGTAEVRLGPGEFFGEIGALSGWPQSVTAKTRTECRLVQIRLPALRLMKRRSAALKDRLDGIYRERSMLPQLRACPLFEGCSEAMLTELAIGSELASYNPGDAVIEEGAPIHAVYLIRSGFVKLSQRAGHGERAVSYLSKGMTFGEVELLLDRVDASQFSVSSVGFAELVKIPSVEVRQLLQTSPAVEGRLWERAVERIKSTGAARADSRRSEFIEVALNEGLVEGNSILVINLDDCTRCDDCVRACASTHEGRPRFVREGERLGNLLVAKSCYHCQDPVCLVGCPTGAIRRANVGDVVEIKETICIGCGTCSSNCPYDAIVMHDTGSVWPDNALPKALRGTPRQVASKCDLCHTSSAGPACVRNCPQGCAFRVGSLEAFAQLQATGRLGR